ncbi:MAG: hypothetical protein Q8Q06_02060 [bacterium]|nr:hypothetical protein [bacterium]
MGTKLKVLCDQAFLSNTGKLNIIGIFDKISANNFPAAHPQMSAVFVIDAGKEGEFDYSLDIKGPDGVAVVNPDGKTHKAKTGSRGVINVIGNFVGVRIEKAGRYVVNFKAGDFEDSVHFDVDETPKGSA